MEKVNVETLQDMPYSGLKKLAKRHGIKANMKRDSMVAALVCKYDEKESFENLENSVINSSRKNKEKKFDADKSDVFETPRRETYSVETPVNVTLPESLDVMASPSLDDALADYCFGYLRGSSKGSKGKPKKQKVSFITPAKSPKIVRNSTPYVSLKDRPKTPIASKVSITKRISFVTPSKSNKKDSLSHQPRKSRPSTPYPLGSSKRASASLNLKETRSSTPCSIISKKKSLETRKSLSINKFDSKKANLPSVSKMNSEHSTSSKKSHSVSTDKPVSVKSSALTGHSVSTDKPVSVKRSAATGRTSASKSVAIKRIATPNFKKIHQEAFDKMESIDDYQKRKALNSAKKVKNQSKQKIPVLKKNKQIATFSGIPFVPSVTNVKYIKFNFASQPKKAAEQSKESNLSLNKNKYSATKKKASKEINSGTETRSASQENQRTKRKLKFDLKASLSRKLPYKPHVGPLKPLTESNLNNSVLSTSCYHKKDETQSQVSKIRNQSREVLRGVRKNRRFDLQMQNRKA